MLLSEKTFLQAMKSGQAQLGSQLSISQDQNQGVSWVGPTSGGCSEDHASKVIEAGNIEFPLALGLSSPFPCWLLVRGL